MTLNKNSDDGINHKINIEEDDGQDTPDICGRAIEQLNAYEKQKKENQDASRKFELDCERQRNESIRDSLMEASKN